MIEFTFKEGGQKHALNLQHIVHADYEDKAIMFTFVDEVVRDFGKNRKNYLLKDEDIEESIDELWQQINGKPKSNMISFEMIGQDAEANGKTNFSPDVIIGFKWQQINEIMIFFDKTKFSVEALGLSQNFVKEPLEDIWKQLCDAKGVKQ